MVRKKRDTELKRCRVYNKKVMKMLHKSESDVRRKNKEKEEAEHGEEREKGEEGEERR